MARTGEDSEGREYADVSQMWGCELGAQGGRSQWYAKAASHWDEQEASLNGVLGGYPETNGPDLRESRRFLNLLRRLPAPPSFGTVLDCGAGIGRVTRGLLLQCFQRVDLVEPNGRLLEMARREVNDSRAERYITSTLQQFSPEWDRYDVIWAQWVLLYLADDDLVQFLVRCKRSLRDRGVICVKENVVLKGNWVVDKEDNSIARTDTQYKDIFERAGLKVIHETEQDCWPKNLIPVKTYALR